MSLPIAVEQVLDTPRDPTPSPVARGWACPSMGRMRPLEVRAVHDADRARKRPDGEG